MTGSWFERERSSFKGQFLQDEPMARHTYYRIGGPARWLAIPLDEDDLEWLAQGIEQTGIRTFLLGAGSNVLVADQGFEGLVIKTQRLCRELTESAPGELRIGCSIAVSQLLRVASEKGWGGFEFLSGVPGSIGGVIRMNAGTHLGEAKDRLLSFDYRLLTPGSSIVRVLAREMKAEYRCNRSVPEGAVVMRSQWRFDPRLPQEVKAVIDATLKRRKETQPIDYPSCGSVFKNPPGHKAWELIDRVGLRGHRIGNAELSQKHCNFIINHGGAKASDVLALISLAQETVRQKIGIELEPEVIQLI